MRLFIAIHLNKTVLNNMKDLISPLGRQYKEVKWVAAQNIHITLKFLGETDEANLNNIIHSLQTIEQKSFSLTIEKTSAFPNLNFPKVIWLGVTGDLKPIIQLSKQVDEQMAQLNFPEEKRKFSPHITIGRVKGKAPKPLLSFLKQHHDHDFGLITIDSFKLMSSELTPKGPIYTIVKDFPLLSGQNP